MSMQTSQRSDGFVETYRETLFVLCLVVGMLVFALGMAFAILTISMNTNPPAPYFASFQDRLLTGVISVVVMIGGTALVRFGARLGGW